MTQKLKTILQYCFFLGLGIFLIWWSVKDLTSTDKLHIKTALQKANYWWVLPGMSVLLVSHWIRALRWRLIMEPLGYYPSKANTFYAVMIGYLANQAVPRLGEVLRCSTLTRYEKIPMDKLLGTVILERFVDAITLLAIFIFTLAIQPDLYRQIINAFFTKQESGGNSTPILLYAFMGLGVLALLGVIWMLVKKKKLIDIFQFVKKVVLRMWEGFTAILHLERRIEFITLTLLIWMLYTASVYAGFMMLTETHLYGVKEAFTVLCAGSLGMVATPGGIGAYAFLVQKTMLLYGLSNPLGLALGWLLWLLQTTIVLVAGGCSLIALPLHNKEK